MMNERKSIQRAKNMKHQKILNGKKSFSYFQINGLVQLRTRRKSTSLENIKKITYIMVILKTMFPHPQLDIQ